MNKKYTILAIETSLDDTAAAVTQKNRVLSNVVASQAAYHEEYGGTVPHLAKRLHHQLLPGTVAEAIKRAHLTNSQLDAIAVTYGPGLAPSLEEGISYAKELGRKFHIPLIPVNHMEGHLLSSLALNSRSGGGKRDEDLNLPALGFLISGGHTQLVLVKDFGKYYLLGETLDDAAGEAYDKVARMLGLGYPGGPFLAELAKKGTPRFALPIPMKDRTDLNFSFSGLKTAVKYALEKVEKPYSAEFTADFAASFEKSVITSLLSKFERAITLYSPKTILLGGGVVSNITLRTAVRKKARDYGIPTFIPYSTRLITDNAAMIGVAAYYMMLRGERGIALSQLDRKPNLTFPTMVD